MIAAHGRLCLFTAVAEWPFAVLAVGAAVLDRRLGGPAPRVGWVLCAVSGVVAVLLTVLAGHSGSAAVWGHLTQ